MPAPPFTTTPLPDPDALRRAALGRQLAARPARRPAARRLRYTQWLVTRYIAPALRS